MNKKTSFFLKRILPILGGALFGYLYYFYIGCNGSCAISGNPYISTLYGAGIGILLSMPGKKQEKNSD
jgi:hypothetical protein